MNADLHIHTNFSGDCETPIRSQIDRALFLGLTEICITDHHDYDTILPDKVFLLDFDHYFSTLTRIQREYQDRIRISIGVELGLQNHIKEVLDPLLLSYPFDFVIGSSHFIDRLDPFYPSFFEGRTERDAYERYFSITLKRIKTLDCFDVFGHLDYVVRYGPNRNQYYSYESYQDYIDPILKTLIEKGKGLECNTGGFRAGLGHPNPTEAVLTRYRELGGEILTIGSDAHTPQQLGYGFDLIKPLLEKCGFRYYTVFHQRKAEFIPFQ